MPTLRQEIRIFQIPPVESSFSKEQKFGIAVQEGVKAALHSISTDFEHPTKRENALTYHNRVHTLGVIWRTGTILREIQSIHPDLVTDHDVALGEFIAAWHDSVQNWTSPDGKKRNRTFGRNEIDSMKQAFSYMRQANQSMGEQVFTVDDMQTVRDALLLTVPNFDPDLGTVTQPRFKNFQDNLIVQAVALADLGGAGMEGLANAVWTTDMLFLEENMDIANYILGQGIGKRRVTRDAVREEEFLQRARKWYADEIPFVTARHEQLELVEIPQMDIRVQQIVQDLFSKDQEVIDGITAFVYGQADAQGRNTMDFPTLAESIQRSLAHPPTYSFSESAVLSVIDL